MKSPLTLHIGNKNYSSWSLRPWLVLRKSELPFDEQLTQLDVPGFKGKLLALSPAGTVPVLQVKGEIIPDSLAISEWAAKAVPNLWPVEAQAREQARALVGKMHNGFMGLRSEAPMNLRRRTQSKMPKACLDDAAEIVALWEQCLSRHNGPFLFDDWSIADAFFTPVATRFESYNLPRSPKADTYISELLSDPDYMDWEADAMIEPWELSETDKVNR
ncbi:MAG: glutathione S-transferase family protein [Robiginitomaculum sp.]